MAASSWYTGRLSHSPALTTASVTTVTSLRAGYPRLLGTTHWASVAGTGTQVEEPCPPGPGSTDCLVTHSHLQETQRDLPTFNYLLATMGSLL